MPLETEITVSWGGRVWRCTGQLAEVVEEVPLRPTGVPRPRRAAFELDLGDVAEIVARGWHYLDCDVEVSIGDEVVLRGGATSLEPGRAGELTRLEVADRVVPRGRMIPSSRSFFDTVFDQGATDRRRRRLERLGREWRAWYDSLTHRQRSIVYGVDINGAAPGGWRAAWWTPIDAFEEAWPHVVVEKQKRVRRVYPAIYGRPGSTRRPAIRLIPIEITETRSTLLVSGRPMRLGTISILGPKQGSTSEQAWEIFDLETMVDGGGVEVVVVNVRDAEILAGHWTDDDPGAADREWWGALDGTAEGLPGHPVDVLVDLLVHADIDVEWGSLFALRDHLAPFALSGVVDDPVPVAELLEQSILPILPIAMVPSLGGWTFRPIEWRGPVRGCLVDGEGAWPLTRPRWATADDDEAVANVVRVRGAPARDGAQFTITVLEGPDTHAVAAMSAQRHGQIELVVETTWMHEREPLEALAASLIERTAHDWRRIDVEVSAYEHGINGTRRIRAGDRWQWVSLGDHLDCPAYVERVVQDGGPSVRLTLVLLEGAHHAA